MTVLRPILLGLAAGAVVAFVLALLRPRRLDDDASEVGGWDEGP
ncbi:hypothetical protein GCM10028777_01450 [Angustibacter speluncae]